MGFESKTARLFSIEEADALVPELQQRVEELMELGLEIQDCVDHLGQEVLGQEGLGQEVLGQEVLGQEVLGQEVLGQEVLGQEVLGQEVLDQEGLVKGGAGSDRGMQHQHPAVSSNAALAGLDEFDATFDDLGDYDGQATIVDVTLQPDDSEDVIRLKQNIVARIEAYQIGWSEIEKLGVVVKNTRSVQLDFYSRLDDRLVRLRWSFGQPGIAFFHELDDIDDRPKALAPFRKRMLN